MVLDGIKLHFLLIIFLFDIAKGISFTDYKCDGERGKKNRTYIDFSFEDECKFCTNLCVEMEKMMYYVKLSTVFISEKLEKYNTHTFISQFQCGKKNTDQQQQHCSQRCSIDSAENQIGRQHCFNSNA